jgi:prepilin-type processing-associated H-X9-DG protein
MEGGGVENGNVKHEDMKHEEGDSMASESTRLTQRPPRHWLRLLAIVVLTVGVTLALYCWRLAPDRELARRLLCQSHLRELGQAILLYSNDNCGLHPPTLDVLVSGGYITPDMFICPSSGDRVAPGATTQQVVASIRANPRHCSYVQVIYIPRSRFNSTLPAEAVIAHEPLTNHDDGLNVLFYDGHIEWLDKAHANHLLAELTAGRNPPDPFRPTPASSR